MCLSFLHVALKAPITSNYRDLGSVDRLGRSLIDLLDFLRELHAKGVDLFLHQQGLDTSTPSGRAMFQMLGCSPNLNAR